MSSIPGAAIALFITTWLAAKHGVAWVGVCLIVAAILTLIALLVTRETNDIPLDNPVAVSAVAANQS